MICGFIAADAVVLPIAGETVIGTGLTYVSAIVWVKPQQTAQVTKTVFSKVITGSAARTFRQREAL